MNTYAIVGLLAIGYYMLNKQSGSPGFVDANGNTLGATIPVGTSISLAVPGYTQVWLTQTKNGAPSFNGLFPVPEPLYTVTIQDIGTYVNNIYQVGPNGLGPGNLIAIVQATIGPNIVAL